MSAPYRSWVEISRRQIAENFRAVRAAVGPGVQTVCVVKADAYGHGAVEVSRTLEAEGAEWLAVSSADEGVTLRQAGISARILVMADCQPFARQAVLECNLTPVILSLDHLRAMNEFVGEQGARLAYHLKLDSGMGRLGTRAGSQRIAEAVRAATNMDLEGLMSHLASSADYTKAQTEEQNREFEEVCGLLEGVEGIAARYRHISSTNAIAYGRHEAWYNMVRPGHLLYGYVSPARGSAPARVVSVKPALTWKASVLDAKEVPEGALIGYGGMFRASRRMRIGVLAVGYADGVSHRLSNRGHVIAAGRLAPILGAVSMDLTTIDLTECPSIGPGDAVTLLGCEGEASINAQQLARMAGTISYDILCGIRARVKRVYV